LPCTGLGNGWEKPGAVAWEMLKGKMGRTGKSQVSHTHSSTSSPNPVPLIVLSYNFLPSLLSVFILGHFLFLSLFLPF
jgi:hypothetical protein